MAGISESIIGFLPFLYDAARHVGAQVDEEEAKLIWHPLTSPVVLLGRSGTGKTTVALLR